MRARGECRRYRISIHPLAPTFAVDSAFNGLSVLRVASVFGNGAASCRYVDAGHANVSSAGKKAICEHVVLNRCFRAHGLRIGIAPALMKSCSCGAICGPHQQYLFRVRLIGNRTLSVYNRRTKESLS